MDVHSSPHPTDQTLKMFDLGLLDDVSAEAVKTHLEDCSDCRKRVAGMSSESVLDRVSDAKKGLNPSRIAGPMVDGKKKAPAPPPAETIPPGLAEHPDYEIKRELGRGGMGVVFLAHNTLLGRDEVLKVMGRHIMERRGVLDRFLREIRAVAKLRHPNIVTAYSAFRIDESIVFAMEYVEGRDLSKMVKSKGPLPVAHASNFVYQTALGLQHAHEEGLVHRDIKPGNLMLSLKGNKATVKVLDFGLAKVSREEKVDAALTSHGQALGTPDFIAPEQITDAKSADIRADIYSLGGTLYYLLTGRPPFEANSLYDIYQAHISRDPDPLNFVRPEVPAELAALVAKMMAKDPARRFQTPGEVAEALTPFFNKANMASQSPKMDVSQVSQTNAGPPQAGAVFEPTQPASNAGKTADRDTKAAETSVAESRWESLIDFREDERVSDDAPAVDRGQRPPWKMWSIILAASLFGLVALGVIILIKIKENNGNEIIVRAEVDGPRKDVQVPLSKPGEAVGSRSPEPTSARTTGPDSAPVSNAAEAPPQVSETDDKPRVSATGAMPATPDDSLRLARSVYVDNFKDSESGWPKGDSHGYSDGVYFVDRHTGYAFWRSPGRIRIGSTLEVVGRVKGESPMTQGSWGVVVHKTTGAAHRGFMVKLNSKGELFVMPNLWTEAKDFLHVDPTIGPIVHPAIKPGDQLNTLLLVMRKQRLEILVNSVPVCEPVTFDFELTPCSFSVGAFDGTANFRAEFSKVEIREFWDDKPRVPPTLYNSIRSATRPFYFDDFSDPGSGWPRGKDSGYSAGVYFVDRDPRDGGIGRNCPRGLRTDSALEVVGRVKSARSSNRESWIVVLNREIGTVRRGFMVRLDGKGELFLRPNPWDEAKDFREVDPRIGPIIHPAIRPGNQINTLLLVIRKRSLEIFVNSVRVCDPVPFDFDLTPSFFQLGAFGAEGDFRAEFDKVAIHEFIRPERDKPRGPGRCLAGSWS